MSLKFWNVSARSVLVNLKCLRVLCAVAWSALARTYVASPIHVLLVACLPPRARVVASSLLRSSAAFRFPLPLLRSSAASNIPARCDRSFGAAVQR